MRGFIICATASLMGEAALMIDIAQKRPLAGSAIIFVAMLGMTVTQALGLKGRHDLR